MLVFAPIKPSLKGVWMDSLQMDNEIMFCLQESPKTLDQLIEHFQRSASEHCYATLRRVIECRLTSLVERGYAQQKGSYLSLTSKSSDITSPAKES